jgi:hypothetical protein
MQDQCHLERVEHLLLERMMRLRGDAASEDVADSKEQHLNLARTILSGEHEGQSARCI